MMIEKDDLYYAINQKRSQIKSVESYIIHGYLLHSCYSAS
jgi:hypothetical protein